jgi:sulfite exporter TauE/SafE
MPALLVTALVVGLAGGVHCMAMCGGIVAALSLRDDPKGPASLRVIRQIAYGLGRVTSYAAAGALAGAVGGLAFHFQHLLPIQIVLLVVANALVVALGLTLAGFRSWMRPLERVGLVVWGALRRVGVRLAPARTPAGAFAVGLAWGWIPCGLVYGVLATALVSGGAARGAAVMAAFGVGTLPNLLAAGLAAERLKAVLIRPRARLVAGAVVVLLGLAGFARIPFIEEHLRQGLHMHH